VEAGRHAIFTQRSACDAMVDGMGRFLALLMLTAFAAAPAAAQPPQIQTREEALAQDGAEYARNVGVSEAEAVSRLRAQAETVAITDEIREAYAARLAGISIEHSPAFRVRVLLTGNVPVANRRIEAGGRDVPIVFETGAKATREQILAAMRRHRDAIRAIIDHDGIGYDARTGSLVVMADESDLGGKSAEAVAARIADLTGVPVRLRSLNQTSENPSGVTGGGRIEGSMPGDDKRYFCTTGFVVTDGARTGIVTAAHCPDSVTYTDGSADPVPLEFAGSWGARFQDVQVHVGPAQQAPVFRASTASRPQLDRRLRSRTRAGETVCHRGAASGYSCAEVELTDFAPPGDLCGGPCDFTWVTVAGPTCRGGDSGGPVFLGATAFGIVKGSNYAADGRCNFYFYMSTDYLPPGWSLLTEGPEAGG
jgi:streptogrisin C